MGMLTVMRPSFLAIVGISAMAVLLSGCPAKEPVNTPKSTDVDKTRAAANTSTEPVAKEQPKEQSASHRKTPAKTEPAEEQVTDAIKQAATKPRDLGPPLVDSIDDLTQLQSKQPVWIDKKDKQVVLQGEVCAADHPLEFFATYPNRSYEAVLSVNVLPWIVHTALLAVGAKEGHPVQYSTPSFLPRRALRSPSKFAGRTPTERSNPPPHSIGFATSRQRKPSIQTQTGCSPAACWRPMKRETRPTEPIPATSSAC